MKKRNTITVSTIVDLTKTARDQGIEIAAKAIEWEYPALAKFQRALKTGGGSQALAETEAGRSAP